MDRVPDLWEIGIRIRALITVSLAMMFEIRNRESVLECVCCLYNFPMMI